MERNITLDYFKLILSILVLGLHTKGFLSEIPLLGHGLHQGLTRIAVPCFFVINGFYLQPILRDSKKIKSYLIKLFIIYIVWMIIYVPFHSIGRIPLDLPQFTLKIITWIIGWGHLWYIVTLITSVFTLFFLKKWNISNKTLGVTFSLLFIVGFCLQRLYLLDIDFQLYAITRTCLFLGLPYIFIGYVIRDTNIVDKIKVSPKTYILAIFLTLSVIVESYLPLHFNRATDFYIALPILCPLLFLIILKKGTYAASDGFISKLSGAIYFNHMFLLFFIRGISEFQNTSLFIVVLFFTLITSTVIVYLNRHLKIFL